MNIVPSAVELLKEHYMKIVVSAVELPTHHYFPLIQNPQTLLEWKRRSPSPGFFHVN